MDWIKKVIREVAELHAIIYGCAGEFASQAFCDVADERLRQQLVEGWTPEHDDAHPEGELAMAAGCYALNAASSLTGDYIDPDATGVPVPWPWAPEWWKPKTTREDLVRAAALLLAEIERMDRAKAQQEQPAAELWCIRIPGPEDIFAMPSREAAEQEKASHDAAITTWYQNPTVDKKYLPSLENMMAVVEPWPYDAESHAEDLLNQAGEQEQPA